MYLQMARAKGSFAVPEKTFTNKNFFRLTKTSNPAEGGDESKSYFISETKRSKLKLLAKSGPGVRQISSFAVRRPWPSAGDKQI
jgi:hypothetical protein